MKEARQVEDGLGEEGGIVLGLVACKRKEMILNKLLAKIGNSSDIIEGKCTKTESFKSFTAFPFQVVNTQEPKTDALIRIETKDGSFKMRGNITSRKLQEFIY